MWSIWPQGLCLKKEKKKNKYKLTAQHPEWSEGPRKCGHLFFFFHLSELLPSNFRSDFLGRGKKIWCNLSIFYLKHILKFFLFQSLYKLLGDITSHGLGGGKWEKSTGNPFLTSSPINTLNTSTKPFPISYLQDLKPKQNRIKIAWNFHYHGNYFVI